MSVPAGWSHVRLDEIAEVIAGQAPPGSSYNSEGVGLPLFQGKTDFGEMYLGPPRLWTTKPSKLARKDDVLLSVRAPVGPTNLAAGDCAIGRGLAAIRGHRGVSQRYLLYALRATAESLTDQATGTTFAAITSAVVRGHIIPLPPLAEQERIVAAIEEEFSRIDAGVAALNGTGHRLKALRSSLLRTAVTGELVSQLPADGDGEDLVRSVLAGRQSTSDPARPDGELFERPATWGLASLEELTDPARVICYGILKPNVGEGGTVPYVEVKDLRLNALSPGGLHRTSPELHRAFRRSILAEGDVVLAIRGSYDRALVVPKSVEGANVSRDVARIAPLRALDPRFLVHYLMSPPVLTYLRRKARGVAVKGVNIADLRSLPVPVPPLAEQIRICAEVSRIQAAMERTSEAVVKGQQRAATLRTAILASAFSGRMGGYFVGRQACPERVSLTSLDESSTASHEPLFGPVFEGLCQ